MDLLEQIVLGNSLEKWLLAADIAVVGTVVLNILFQKFEDEQIVFAFPSRTIYFADDQKSS